MKIFSHHSRTVFLNGKYLPRKAISYRLYCHQEDEIFETTKWKPAVGLEIHAQIASNSKLFSMAPTDFSRPINSGIALFDCATPGTLPMLNRRCVEAGVLTSLALGCQINETSIFERKHYFYSDLPAGFQITQQKKPLAVNGKVNFCVRAPGGKFYKKSSKIKQIQLEQDSGKSLHCEVTQRSLIDLNRAGTPLMELVFEPDLNDGEEAASLVKELLLIFELLGTCSCKMEEGALRVDANVSVSQDPNKLGTRTELKNIGSIKSVSAAIKYEIKRQISIIEKGDVVVNETRAWDANKHKTVLMREKEEKQDYRFMPENNLPFLRLHVDESKENNNNLVDVVLLSKSLPALPKEIRNNLQNKLNLPIHKVMVISADIANLRLYYSLIKGNTNRDPNLVYNFLINHVFPVLKEHNLDVTFYTKREEFLGQIVDLLQSETINLAIAKDILNLQVTDEEIIPRQVVEDNKWFQIMDEKELEKICLDVIQENEKIVKKYKAGKKKVIGALLGQIFYKSNKCANMSMVVKILERLLNSDT